MLGGNDEPASGGRSPISCFVPEDALAPCAVRGAHRRRPSRDRALRGARCAVVGRGAVAVGTRPPPGPARMLAFGDARFPLDDERNPPETRAYFAAFAANGGLTPTRGIVHGGARSGPPLAALGGDAGRGGERKRISSDCEARSVSPHPLRDARARSTSARPGRSAIALAAGGGEDGFVTSSDLGRTATRRRSRDALGVQHGARSDRRRRRNSRTHRTTAAGGRALGARDAVARERSRERGVREALLRISRRAAWRRPMRFVSRSSTRSSACADP